MKELPVDLSWQIFSFFSVRDLTKAAQVENSWNILSRDPLLWKNHLNRNMGLQLENGTKEDYKKKYQSIVAAVNGAIRDCNSREDLSALYDLKQLLITIMSGDSSKYIELQKMRGCDYLGITLDYIKRPEIRVLIVPMLLRHKAYTRNLPDYLYLAFGCCTNGNKNDVDCDLIRLIAKDPSVMGEIATNLLFEFVKCVRRLSGFSFSLARTKSLESKMKSLISEIPDLLIAERKANVNAIDSRGVSLLKHAQHHKEIYDQLVLRGASQVGNDGRLIKYHPDPLLSPIGLEDDDCDFTPQL